MNKNTQNNSKTEQKLEKPKVEIVDNFARSSELNMRSRAEENGIEVTKKLNEAYLHNDFEIQNGDNIIDSKIDFDPKLLYSNSLQTKRKPAIYSSLRTFLIVIGLFLFVLMSALLIGYNISEFENPNFTANQAVTEITEVIKPSTNQPNIIIQRPAPKDDNPHRVTQLPPEIAQKIHQHREQDLVTRVLGLSFEFVIIAATLTLLSYLIYRHTDWPFVKNKLLLAFLIVLVSVIISLGFWTLFRHDNRIPRALRGHRDNWRERIMNRHQINSNLIRDNY